MDDDREIIVGTQTRQQLGFTLIEILVVVTIIGIIATITLLGLGAARGSARDARRLKDLKSIQVALEVHFAKTGDYPPALLPDLQTNYRNMMDVLRIAGTISQMPHDPRVSNIGDPGDYGYAAPWFGGGTYIVFAALEGPLPGSYVVPTIPQIILNGLAASGGGVIDCATLYCVVF